MLTQGFIDQEGWVTSEPDFREGMLQLLMMVATTDGSEYVKAWQEFCLHHTRAQSASFIRELRLEPAFSNHGE